MKKKLNVVKTLSLLSLLCGAIPTLNADDSPTIINGQLKAEDGEVYSNYKASDSDTYTLYTGEDTADYSMVAIDLASMN